MKTQTKEHPILFGGEMVRAILDGRKTQTRRVIKHQGCALHEFAFYEVDGNEVRDQDGKTKTNPFGEPGSRLWVRETFWKDSRVNYDDHPGEIFYDATPEIAMDHRGEIINATYLDGVIVNREDSLRNIHANKFWSRRPSIFMPRWASRITLEVKAVRVERLQDISEEDAIAEGCEPIDNPDYDPDDPCDDPEFSHVASFCELWDSITKDAAYKWASNPWVRVVDFVHVQQETSANRSDAGD